MRGNFDIILERFSRISQITHHPNAQSAALYHVAMLIGCIWVLATRCPVPNSRLQADGAVIESVTIANVLLYWFTSGVGIRLAATNGGGIAYCSFYDVRIRHALTAIEMTADANVNKTARHTRHSTSFWSISPGVFSAMPPLLSAIFHIPSHASSCIIQAVPMRFGCQLGAA